MNCIFCGIVAGEIPARIVYSDDKAVAFLDVNPAQKGHTVVIPKVHSENLLSSPGLLATLAESVDNTAKLLVDKLAASGLNYLSNSGEVAGQTVFHTHIHLIPRYESDPGMRSMMGKTDQSDLDEVFAQIVSQ